jgi:hypothetical protein
MEATLGISLYNYVYLKLAEMLCFSYHLCFLSNKIGELEGGNRFCLEAGVGREVAQAMYTDVSKRKNDKIK